MLDRLPTVSPITLAADRGFDARDFIIELRERRVTPHIAQNTSGRRSAIDGRTTRHPGSGARQRVRKRIEEAFAWIKAIAGQFRTKLRGLARVRWSFMRDLVLGKQVRCTLDGEQTRDRCVAICYLNGTDITEVIIRRGLARDCPRFSGGRYARAEEAARLDGMAIRATYSLPDYCRPR